GGWQPEGRLLSNALGGGGILDVGCYCTSMARLIAGAALGRNFAEPIEVKGAAHIGETRVDEWAIASLKFPGGIVAQLATGVQLAMENVVRIYGSEGQITLTSPWFGSREAGSVSFQLKRKNEPQPREVTVEYYAGPYTMEADVVAQNLEKRQAPSPAMSWDDTLGNMKTLDRWRESIGLLYDRELPEAWVHTVARQPLRPRPGHPMRYGTIPGLEKPISRLVMGSMAHNGIAYASVMYDDFVERGGTTFDTAWIYGGGRSEVLLGQWIKNRGNREEVVILGKGAHTPFCDPESLTRQLYESLDRLQTDYIDIYLMHRDNPEVPVGEFIEVLNEHQRAGRMRLFGVSNWTLERVDAANAYARAKGLMGIACVSNNFSLARMVAPVWEGCVSSSDRESRAWFERTQMPLMAWSSQARGFFVRGRPDFTADRSLVTCWYSDDNFERLERAKKLAAELGVLPTNVALAYVLCQPFPTYALVGPQSLVETRTTLPALNLQLTPQQLRWLNLEE
ncbi:MAG: aldo/keto reductase, partial [Armatimonadota bacterium]|nr:aldo/keto reductase [Armatimonadota bacterium]